MFDVFGQIFVSFLLIMNPFTTAVYFLGISKKFTAAEKADAINSATIIAGATLLLFLFLGPFLLSVLGISVSSFQVAGGIVLLLISVNFILGNLFERSEPVSKDASIMIIGVPLITGPGVLTTTIIMVGAYGQLQTLVAAVAALAVSWVILRLSESARAILGDRGMDISSRIMGLLLAAVAVEFIKRGVLAIMASGA